jgi:primosomal protein N' (replication factor Y)
MYADCADVLVASVLSDPLMYVIPKNLIDVVQRGTIVLVQLGRVKVLGVVIRVYTADIDSVGFCVKEIYECIHDEITLCDDVIELIKWIRDYYFTTTKSVLETIIPVSIRSNIHAKTEAFISCTGKFTHDVCESLKKKTPEQYRLGKFLLECGKQILKKELNISRKKQ